MTDLGLKKVANHLAASLKRDALVQETTDNLRVNLQVDRIVVYYFYRPWQGQVTFESLSQPDYSIYGSTGPDECFNGEYAALYEAGRVRAIADIEQEAIAPCHRDFLRQLHVRANLVVPILNEQGLWGLLIAHQCQSTRSWSSSDIVALQKGAQALAKTPSIRV